MSRTPINQIGFPDNSNDNSNYSTTSTPSNQNYNKFTLQGWECPRCGCINAPWVSQCNCSNNNNWYITCNNSIGKTISSITYNNNVPKTYTYTVERK